MIDRDHLKQRYGSLLEDDFLPYWIPFIDRDHGGLLNCINNYGDKKLSDHKFTWSQGRWLWVLGRLKTLGITYPSLEADMKGTYDFIIQNAIDDDDRCCYLLDRNGEKLLDERTGRYDASVFADCFALIGMAQYVKTMHKREEVQRVERLYESIVKRVKQGDFLTEPYPIPDGYQVHSIPMILVNSTYEYVKMLEYFQLDCKAAVQSGLGLVHKILDEMTRCDLIREHSSTEENYRDLLLDRHVNPGHTLEDIWFMAEYLKDYGSLETYLPKLIKMACHVFDLGWDLEYGGLLRFVDRDGGQPKGKENASAFEKLIQNTWDMKLWWPHSEALYVFLYLYELSGEERLLEYYEKVERYVFDTFPNQETGEWIQIRKRDGEPEEKVVALPVKDPFHIMRNFIKIVELYRE